MTTWTGTKRLFAITSLTVACAASTGCEIDVGGQTLPSPYYIYDDIQYFPAGPEFKLTNEANAMKAAKAQEALGE